ncbi:MAG: iron-sulfur cluster repair di-iron protein [Bradymonadaceae bacterium]
MIEPTQTVNEITRRFPNSTRVFARHKISFCCGGGVSLAEACNGRNVDVARVIAELERENALEQPSALDGWSERPIPELVEHILERYHRPLDEELPRLAFLSSKVARVHGERDAALPRIAAVFFSLHEELENHFRKEEQILFPMITSGAYQQASAPIAVMLAEHDVADDLLRKLRELTRDYTVPVGACGSWRALWAGLEALELSLHEHIHLENNILFERVLQEG